MNSVKRKNEETAGKNSLFGFYLKNIGSNLFGFGAIVILNLITPLDFIKTHRYYLFKEGGWLGFFLFFPFIMLLVILLQVRVQSPITKLTDLIQKGDEISRGVRGKRRQEASKFTLSHCPYQSVGLFIFPCIYCCITLFLQQKPAHNLCFHISEDINDRPDRRKYRLLSHRAPCEEKTDSTNFSCRESHKNIGNAKDIDPEENQAVDRRGHDQSHGYSPDNTFLHSS